MGQGVVLILGSEVKQEAVETLKGGREAGRERRARGRRQKDRPSGKAQEQEGQKLIAATSVSLNPFH